MRIDLVLNPHARLYQRRPNLIDRMRQRVAGRCEVHVTRSLGELDELAGELARRGTDLVLLSGGDGSLMAGVSALERAFGPDQLPAVAPVPGGTAGTVARNWGAHGDPLRCLERLLEGPRRLVERPSLEVEARTDGQVTRQVGFIVGTGLVANFFGLYYERGAPGYLGAAALVSRIFVESFVGGPVARRVLDPLPCTLEVDGHAQRPSAWSLICAAVVPNLGIHMLVTYRAAEDPLRPHLVASPLAPRDLGPRAPLVLAGRRIGGEDHVDRLASTFTIRFPTIGPFVLDGELIEASEVVVRAGPMLTVASA
jgi:diacylglycerol kinase family enzyme